MTEQSGRERRTANEHPRLKLGKGAAFVKAHLKRVPQERETWEADFRALPKPAGQAETHYLGLVVALPGGDPLVYLPVEYTPTVNAASAAWRARMKTDEAKAIYKERASVAECVSAQARNRGLLRLLVRGLRKVRAVALWYAIAHNVRRGLSLRGLLPAPG
jgi:hypothetical protein